MRVRGGRLLGPAAFGLLTLVGELTGRSLTTSLDRAIHVMPIASAQTSGYPLMLAAVRLLAALVVGRVAWRLIQAHATAAAGERLLSAVGSQRARAPRLRLRASSGLWLLCFAATALWFLVQTDAESFSQGRWPLLAPWLHTFALPAFAVVATVLSLLWALARDWLAEVERYAHATLARAFRAVERGTQTPRRPGRLDGWAPRQLFGLALDSRPPPLPA